VFFLHLKNMATEQIEMSGLEERDEEKMQKLTPYLAK
jgi:hypothetical protein